MCFRVLNEHFIPHIKGCLLGTAIMVEYDITFPVTKYVFKILCKMYFVILSYRKLMSNRWEIKIKTQYTLLTRSKLANWGYAYKETRITQLRKSFNLRKLILFFVRTLFNFPIGYHIFKLRMETLITYLQP